MPEIAETTALGAAYLAGIATGVWSTGRVGEMWRQAARYEPRMGEDEREALLAGWREALRDRSIRRVGPPDRLRNRRGC